MWALVGVLIMFGSALGLFAGCVLMDVVRIVAWRRRMDGLTVRVQVRSAWRLRVWLPVVWRARRARGAVRLRARLVWVRVRERAGYGRSAGVLAAVCVPVWMTRYQVGERLGSAWVWVSVQFRAMFAVELGWVGK